MSDKKLFYVTPIFNKFMNYNDKPIYVNIKGRLTSPKEYFIKYNDENKIIKIDEKYLGFHDIYETQYDKNGNSIYEFTKYDNGKEIKIYKTYNRNNDIISFTQISDYWDNPFTRIFKYNEDGELILEADTDPYSSYIAYNHNKTECFKINTITDIRIEISKDKKQKTYYEINSEKPYYKEYYNDDGYIESYYDFIENEKKEFFYNNDNSISKIILKRIPDETLISTIEYFYDRNGNLSSTSDGDIYKYDDKNRLIYKSILSPIFTETFYKYED